INVQHTVLKFQLDLHTVLAVVKICTHCTVIQILNNCLKSLTGKAAIVYSDALCPIEKALQSIHHLIYFHLADIK
uniref:Uncharacterized protein n=1 Tax=Romanomermis culicivorax TaxID=13658 RepID=A0A915ISE2_ROMCU